MNNTKIGLWKHAKSILTHNSWYKNQSPAVQFIYLWAKFSSDNVVETSVRYWRQNWWFASAIWSAKFNVNRCTSFLVKTWRLYVQFLIIDLLYALHVRSHGGRQRGFKETERWKQINIYRVSQEECARLREGVPCVKVYRYNPKHLCPNLNGYGDNGQRSLKHFDSCYTLIDYQIHIKTGRNMWFL